MQKLEKFKEYIIPIITILLSVGSFFTGRWVEKEQLELQKEDLLVKKVTFEQELARLKDEHQKDLQFKYIELLSKNLDEETFFKAEIIIHLIEDPEVRIKFSNYTQKLIKQKDQNIGKENIIGLKESFASTSYEARKEIEKEDDQKSNDIIKRAEKEKTHISKSDSLTLERIDKKEQAKNESKFNTYKSFISLLNKMEDQGTIEEDQLNKYVALHIEILNKYADENLKVLMDDLFDSNKDKVMGQKTHSLIEEISKTMNDELSQTLWCKSGYYILWKDVKCTVVDVQPSKGVVIIDLIDTKSKKVIRENLVIKENESIPIDELGFSIHLTKIDSAGKNIFKKAGFFTFSRLK